MKKAKVAYKPTEEFAPEEVIKGKVDEMHGHQEIKCHVIFYVKMHFTRKIRSVANGINTEAPGALTYSSIVARGSVRLSLLTAALNDLDMMAFDIDNAYINSPCKDNIWFKAGAECGDHQGNIMILVRSLYGLKT